MKTTKMDNAKVSLFMELGGQAQSKKLIEGSEDLRVLGAQLLLSEVLEYVIKGLGLTPEIDGQKVTDPNNLQFSPSKQPGDKIEMIDGLADVAYTMYWNALAFGIPLEEAFSLVCDNNLEKFTKLDSWTAGAGKVEPDNWGLGQGIEWPEEVSEVVVIKAKGNNYAVGKDKHGKVRKPKHYRSVNLEPLLQANSK